MVSERCGILVGQTIMISMVLADVLVVLGGVAAAFAILQAGVSN